MANLLRLIICVCGRLSSVPVTDESEFAFQLNILDEARDILLLRIRRMNGDGRDTDGKFFSFGQDAQELRDLVILSTMLILSESEI
jgi:hypothetical protein